MRELSKILQVIIDLQVLFVTKLDFSSENLCFTDIFEILLDEIHPIFMILAPFRLKTDATIF
jgi:hypothetical protein